MSIKTQGVTYRRYEKLVRTINEIKMSKHNCRVCGLYIDDLPWGEEGNCPSYEICSCCGVEFGNEDYSVESVKHFWKKWINEGLNWFEPTEKPEKWDKEEQFKNIPLDFI